MDSGYIVQLAQGRQGISMADKHLPCGLMEWQRRPGITEHDQQ